MYWHIIDFTICLPFQVIYVSRNAKDATVSFYHHHCLGNSIPGTFREFAECARQNLIEFNPIIPHVLEAWRLTPHPYLFFTTYEQMKVEMSKILDDLVVFLRGKGLNTTLKVV